MKHYLTRAQMRELAEIGFDTRQLATHECNENGITYFSLSIGDLIEMLPTYIDNDDCIIGSMLSILPVYKSDEWLIMYDYPIIAEGRASELIDALFDMLVWLKKEGKI